MAMIFHHLRVLLNQWGGRRFLHCHRGKVVGVECRACSWSCYLYVGADALQLVRQHLEDSPACRSTSTVEFLLWAEKKARP